MMRAPDLRGQFRALPRSLIAERQPFAIRVWRGLSWLERAEAMDLHDHEGRFISAWIGVNSLYGRLGADGRPWGDHEALGTFLARIWRQDQSGRLKRLLGKRQLQVLKLIENKYLSRAFWEEGESAVRQVRKELRSALAWYGTRRMQGILRLLFDRLYVMRNQVFHGASTKGSSLNRRTLQSSGTILLDLLPEMLTIMIGNGIEEDWGEICFAPS